MIGLGFMGSGTLKKRIVMMGMMTLSSSITTYELLLSIAIVVIPVVTVVMPTATDC
jgi:hypothetical protein